jgi:hypothetical protein
MSSSDSALGERHSGSHTFRQDLLPCPFGCTNTPYLQTFTKAYWRAQFYGACVCGATGPRCHRREDAVEAWNTRNTSGEDRDAALALAASIVRRRAAQYSGGFGRIEPQLTTAAEEIEALRTTPAVSESPVRPAQRSASKPSEQQP